MKVLSMTNPWGYFLVHPVVGFTFVDAWELSEPIPCRGNLGLWDAPSDVIERVTRLRSAA